MILGEHCFVVEKRRYADVKPEGSYVYAHVRLDTFHPFYIGKGKGPRGWILNKRNPHHVRTIKKLEAKGVDWAVAILCEGLTSEEAYKLEREVIACIGRDALTNLNDGGIGSSGYKPTPEMVAYLAAKKRGMKMPRDAVEKSAAAKRGIPRPAEVREKLSKALKGIKHPHDRNMRKSLRQKGVPNPKGVENMNKATRKPVICVDTGEVFPSASDAARKMGILREGIRDTVNGRQKTAGGYRFQFFKKEEEA